jgi:hypothetical protein
MDPKEEKRLLKLLMLPTVLGIGGGVLVLVLVAAVAILRTLWHSL